MTVSIEPLCAIKCELGEGPVWEHQTNSLVWVDIVAAKMHRWNDDTGDTRTWQLPFKAFSATPTLNGQYVLTTRRGFAIYDPDTENVRSLEDPEPEYPLNYLNDAKCDGLGRLWAGSMDSRMEKKLGSLYRLDPTLSQHKIDSSIWLSNGIDWSPDNSILYFVDTKAERIYAYDFDLESGAASDRRLFRDTSNEPGSPDGLTVDASGNIWVASWDGWCLHRYSSSGELAATIALPVQRPTSLIFGGQGFADLFVTTATHGLEGFSQRQSMAGQVLRVRAEGYTGRPAREFAYRGSADEET